MCYFPLLIFRKGNCEISEKNTEILKSNGDIDSVDWVYFKVGDYDYELQNGDITMQRPYAKHHGDIVTPAGRIGGNLGGPGSVNATKSKTTGKI